MIFMGNGSAKEGHDAVAQHLIHRVLVAVYGLHHGIQRWVQQPVQTSTRPSSFMASFLA